MALLLIEDDAKVGQLVERGLMRLNYQLQWVTTLRAAREAMALYPVELIILDLGLPDGDGLDFLKEIRAVQIACPVIILSARGHIDDRIRGLDLGSDDYLPKPFGFEELVARIRSLQRRQGIDKRQSLQVGDLSLDLNTRQVQVGDERIELTRREFDLLEYFMANHNRVLTRLQISEEIWEMEAEMESNLIEVYIRKLRKKLAHGLPRDALRTVRGVGYKLQLN